MTDETIEPSPVAEIFFDGVSEIHITDQVFRCTLYSLQRTAGVVAPMPVAVARMAVPVTELPDIIQGIVTAMTNAARVLVRVKAPHNTH